METNIKDVYNITEGSTVIIELKKIFPVEDLWRYKEFLEREYKIKAIFIGPDMDVLLGYDVYEPNTSEVK